MGFKARLGSLIHAWWRHMCWTTTRYWHWIWSFILSYCLVEVKVPTSKAHKIQRTLTAKKWMRTWNYSLICVCWLNQGKKEYITRMNSSRMHTAPPPHIDRIALFSASWGGGGCGGGGGLTWRGEAQPPGHTSPSHTSPSLVTPPHHTSPPIRPCDLSHDEFDVPPPVWTEWVTHACDNITFVRFATRAIY